MWHIQVDMALIPAISGDFGVMPGHVPTVAELRPGIVAVHNTLDKDVEKYFVSGGFAVAHADSSVEVTVVEAANVEDLDPAAIKTGLAEYTARCFAARLSEAARSNLNSS
jgi:F-type H+-transporting ATPase subunit delta